ncbi:hypothetical protein Bca4012_102666 [Brassica carinata]
MTQSPHATPGQAGSPLSLSISISGGKETNKDSLSSGEREEPSLKIGRLGVGVVWASSAADRAQVPWKGAPESPNRAVNSVKAKYGRDRWRTSTASKDEKDFEKRVKECLKLSGGSGWGRRCVGRMRAEQSGPPDRFGRGRRIKGGVAALLSHPTESRAPSGPFLVAELAMRDEPEAGYGAQLRANLEPTKGVGRLRQQGGGHGSRNPLRSV